jgi:NAD(P)-dependent dehydrogenase (short-subunit alcohol dehydrogenase family)/acyl carrier protein
VTHFSAASVVEAYRHMAQAHHMGKVVVKAASAAAPPAVRKRATAMDPAGIYVLTGGLGGIGLAVACWLVEKGARRLVLVGRHLPGPEATATLQRLRAAGAEVRVERADVAVPASLAAVFDPIDRARLRGVFHIAGVLEDGPTEELDVESATRVLAPKVDGAWNLHGATLEAPLDFFVLFSSASALFGAPGQASYAAANAFLDALAHHRRSLGLAALSVAWGAWSEVGMAAALIRPGGRLAERGYQPLSTARALAALEELLEESRTYAAIVPLDLERWRDAHPGVSALPFVSKLDRAAARHGTDVAGALAHELRSAPPAEGRMRLQDHVRQQVARVLGADAEQLDLHTPFETLGLDSLMTVELKNRLEHALGLPLSTSLLWAHPTITSLARLLVERLGLEDAAAGPLPEAASFSSDEANALADALTRLANGTVPEVSP